MSTYFWQTVSFIAALTVCFSSQYVIPTARHPSQNANAHQPGNLRPSGEQNNQAIVSETLLCYTDKTAQVVGDVACPQDSSQKLPVTSHLLDVFLKEQGIGILSPSLSALPPDHLGHFDLTDIESADWMNYNRSDLSFRLQALLQTIQDHNNQYLDHLMQYLSSESLRNITILTTLLLDIMNSSSEFSICANATYKYMIADEMFCEQIQADTEILKYINIQATNLLEFAMNSSNSTKSDADELSVSAESNLGDSITDLIIDNQYKKLHGLKAESKILAELQQKLLSAVKDLKIIIIKIVKKLLISLLESSSFEITRNIFTAMETVQSEIGLNNGTGVLSLKLLLTTRAENPDSTSVVDSINKMTEHYGISTQQPVTETSNRLHNVTISVNSERGLRSGLIDHSEKSETTVSVSFTNKNIQYFEQIIEISIILISSISELLKLINHNDLANYEPDEVLENLTQWHEIRSRTKRDVSGYTIASDKCQKQGNLIDQTNYISLCSSCIHTTVLDNNFYPRYLTEKICSSSNPVFSNGCLYQPGPLGTRPGGVCKQQEFHILLLQRVPGKCMKVMSHGQEIVTDQWQTTTHPLRIGCECVIDQNSQFTKYTHYP